jgi:hypothetical protein
VLNLTKRTINDLKQPKTSHLDTNKTKKGLKKTLNQSKRTQKVYLGSNL